MRHIPPVQTPVKRIQRERCDSGLGVELDAAADELGFLVGHWLVRGRSCDGVPQEVVLDRARILRVIDSSVVNQLAVFVEEERLGRASRAERARYIRSGIRSE